MEDQRLGEILRQLPRETARPGFTTRVLARLDGERPRRRAPVHNGRLRFALAASALVLVTVAAGRLRRDEPRPTPTPASTAAVAPAAVAQAQGTLRELRNEHDQLRRELEALRQPRGSAPSSVLYVGGNDEMDLVIDLSRVRAEGGRTGGARLASPH
ncbi:MAG TPA: hypothetical protein VGE98_05045, partial [Thermoanaerobaculia bacterium]